MTCPICYEDMDMLEYKDEAEGTETCHKLECGHAFHTKCIISCLTKSHHACPSCNKVKLPQEQLGIETLIRSTLMVVRRDPRVKDAKKEYETGKAEYKELLRQLQKEGKAWLEKRAEELKIKEYRSYYYRSGTAVMSAAREVAKELGPRYIAALNSDRTPTDRWGTTISKKVIFGENPPGYRDWRVRNPRIWLRL